MGVSIGLDIWCDNQNDKDWIFLQYWPAGRFALCKDFSNQEWSERSPTNSLNLHLECVEHRRMAFLVLNMKLLKLMTFSNYENA